MKPISIIIPVYNAFDVTVDCLRSVFLYSPRSVRVVVIDDASPSGELVSAIPDDIKKDARFVFLRNERNLGFVGSCNRGMLFESEGDVILLNSDTIVTPRWVQKLSQAAYCRPRIGTVTPLTNNGTIASVPRFLENNEAPAGMDINQFARLIENLSVRQYVSVPTCVGFCTYVRREMLDAVGVFDPVFKKGYGEENDLSLRGAERGFDNIIDDATYVYHRGSMSFKEMREALSLANLKILNQRYPGYDARIAAFCGVNPLGRIHDRIWNHLQKKCVRTKERTVLHILSNGPFVELGKSLGNVEFLVQSIVRNNPQSAHFSLVAESGCLRLIAHLADGDRAVVLPGSFDLASLLKRSFFDFVHVHDIAAFNLPRVVEALKSHGRYLVSVHNQDTLDEARIEGEWFGLLLNHAKRVVVYSGPVKEAVAQVGADLSTIEVCSLQKYPFVKEQGEMVEIADLYGDSEQAPQAQAEALMTFLQPDLVNAVRGPLERFGSMMRRTLLRWEAA